MKSITKLLIANRGEIAVRIMKTCKKMGIETVAVYSEADRKALHVSVADAAEEIGPPKVTESYLNIDKIIAAAKKHGVDAIHPGYGFLAENYQFAARCESENFILVGPSSKVIAEMGLKILAKKRVAVHGIPIVPGYDGGDQSEESFILAGREIGYPLLVKSSAGGGGKGMRVVASEEKLSEALNSARCDAIEAFGDGTLLLEKLFSHARHIEFQILADQTGKIVHCFERECSIQRRYQKIIEETPSPILTPELRARMGHAAIQVAKSVNYIGAGTIEFLLNGSSFYFLEMNTRLQVEHAITEVTTGLDLVAEQIKIATGAALSFEQADLTQNGHAVECRLYAEDTAHDFRPCTGKVEVCKWAESEIARTDSGIQSQQQISVYYDPMIAKITTHAASREDCIKKMKLALKQTVVLGVTTNQNFLQEVLAHKCFTSGGYDTGFIESHFMSKSLSPSFDVAPFLIAAFAFCFKQRNIQPQFMPPGWRNNFYSPQKESYRCFGNTYTLQYRCATRECADVWINEDSSHRVVGLLDDGIDEQLRLEINGTQWLFHVACRFNGVDDTLELFLHQASMGTCQLTRLNRLPRSESKQEKGRYTSPLPGKIRQIFVEKGSKVVSGDRLLTIESMKMENIIGATHSGTVTEVFVSPGEMIQTNSRLFVISEEINGIPQ